MEKYTPRVTLRLVNSFLSSMPFYENTGGGSILIMIMGSSRGGSGPLSFMLKVVPICVIRNMRTISLALFFVPLILKGRVAEDSQVPVSQRCISKSGSTPGSSALEEPAANHLPSGDQDSERNL